MISLRLYDSLYWVVCKRGLLNIEQVSLLFHGGPCLGFHIELFRSSFKHLATVDYGSWLLWPFSWRTLHCRRVSIWAADWKTLLSCNYHALVFDTLCLGRQNGHDRGVSHSCWLVIIVITCDLSGAVTFMVIKVDNHFLGSTSLGRIELPNRSRVGNSRIQDELGPVALALQTHGKRCFLALQKNRARTLTATLKWAIVSDSRNIVQHDLAHFQGISSFLRRHSFCKFHDWLPFRV